jgi:hypothetical protein
MLKPFLVASAFLIVFSSIQAEARPQHRHHGYRGWCGSYLSKYLGKPDRRLALAHSWASEGMNAGGPGIGVVITSGSSRDKHPTASGSFIAATMAARFVREPDRSPARLHSGACRKWIALSLCSIPLLATASDVIERLRQRTCFEELGDCTQGSILGCHGGET